MLPSNFKKYLVMKKIKISFFRFSFLFFANILLFSCSNFGDMNIDPNRVTSADPQLLLTNVIWSMFNDIDQDPLYASRVLVQSDGESSLVYYKWNRGSFAAYNKLRDITKMREEAQKKESTGHEALALFFRSVYFYNLTLTFGDVPYSEALKGETDNIYSPKYDSQEYIFKNILEELKTANDMLQSTSDIIQGDIIYGGNPNKWQKAVNSFRLKVLMTLSKKESSIPTLKSDFAGIYNNQPLISSNSDNMQVVYIDKQGNRYPLFNDSGFGSGKYMDSTFVALMATRKDPRLITFVTQTKNSQDKGLPLNDYSSYDGGDPIKPYANVNEKAVRGDISKPHPRFYESPTNEPNVFIGYTETELIIAEAIVRGWIAGDAKTHYDNAIRASFDFYNTYVPGFEEYLNLAEADKYINSPFVDFTKAKSVEEKLELIMIQEYISTYFQNSWSAFYNYLRTGYPLFRMADGVTMPTRWMYPQSEYNNNAKNVQDAISTQFGGEETIRNDVWWLK